jgi:hypothetical protein
MLRSSEGHACRRGAMRAFPTRWPWESNRSGHLLGDAGRNDVVVGPGLKNFDFPLFKDHKIKENWNLQFRAEFFNVFNHSNFESPIDNSTLFDSTGALRGSPGLIDATSTANREIQLTLKLIF